MFQESNQMKIDYEYNLFVQFYEYQKLRFLQENNYGKS